MSLLGKVRKKVNHLIHPKLGEILMLHRVIPEDQLSSIKSNRELEITPSCLEELIWEYKKNGFQFVSLNEVYLRLQELNIRRHPVKVIFCVMSNIFNHNNRFVCITFDDGYKDNYEFAYPILKREHIPFSIFVTTDFVDNKTTMWWYPGESLGMSLNQLSIIAKDPLCTIGAHTISHPRLEDLSVSQQEKEIVESKLWLEERLGHAIDYFSYPHGSFNEQTKRLVREAGFKMALHAWGGNVKSTSPFNELPRIIKMI